MIKRKTIIVILLIILISFGVIIEKYVIFQEGNPAKMIVAISKLHITGEPIRKISSQPDKYIVRNKDGFKPFIEMKEKEGWKFVDQLGSGLVLEKNGIKHTCIGRMFTRFYRVIKE